MVQWLGVSDYVRLDIPMKACEVTDFQSISENTFYLNGLSKFCVLISRVFQILLFQAFLLIIGINILK